MADNSGTVMENWLPIAGYEGLYEVSDLGRVRSLVRRNNRWKPGVLKPRKDRRGYLHVRLYKDGKVKDMSVHRLVAEAFIPNPLNLETVNHKDENKQNNAGSNLEWMSVADNINYGTRNRRIAEARKGRTFSEETKRKMSEAKRKYWASKKSK